MFFKDIIGQNEAKQHLLALIHEGKMPHAMLFCGIQGTGKLPLALATARYLCCENPDATDACGKCPSCIKMNKYIHPDVHFAFPIIKKKVDAIQFPMILSPNGVNCLSNRHIFLYPTG